MISVNRMTTTAKIVCFSVLNVLVFHLILYLQVQGGNVEGNMWPGVFWGDLARGFPLSPSTCIAATRSHAVGCFVAGLRPRLLNYGGLGSNVNASHTVLHSLLSVLLQWFHLSLFRSSNFFSCKIYTRCFRIRLQKQRRKVRGAFSWLLFPCNNAQFNMCAYHLRLNTLSLKFGKEKYVPVTL